MTKRYGIIWSVADEAKATDLLHGTPESAEVETDISAYSQAKLNAVARKLNDRPRKTLNYETPAERYRQSVASSVEFTAESRRLRQFTRAAGLRPMRTLSLRASIVGKLELTLSIVPSTSRGHR